MADGDHAGKVGDLVGLHDRTVGSSGSLSDEQVVSAAWLG
jgi:hypothetical protein